ncbi:FAD-dependent oxidoreductase [Spirillospora sp. NPDC127200]
MLRPAKDRRLPEGLGPHGRGSYWIESTPPTSYPRLEEDAVVDVAVVGGGIAGLSAAWELTRAGRTVAVLEARRIVSGATGHTTGRLSALHPYLYRPLHKAHGAEAARLYAHSQQDAVEHVIRTAARLGIDCELELRPSHVFVTDPDEAAELRDEGEAVREAGLPAEYVTGTGRSGHVYAATGFARSGMSHGVMAGKLLAALMTGRRPAWADLYDPRREDAPVMESGEPGAHRRTGDRTVADIAPGTGDVVRIDGRPCAVHRDEDGALHALTAVCPYSGCLVVFNEVDRTWESPCHGSRFDLDGTVLDGPATEPLEPVEIEE